MGDELSTIAGRSEAQRALPVSYSIFLRRIGTGRLQDVRSNIDALKRLGVTKVHLSPIYPQTTSSFNMTTNDHGYWPSDHGQVGEEIGGEGQFKTLLSDARAADIEIVFDLVLSHFGYGHELSEHQISFGLSQPDSFRVREEAPAQDEPPFDLPHRAVLEQASVYVNYSPFELPFLNQSRSEVRDYIADSYRRFIRRGVNNFRVDAARHMSVEYIAHVINDILSCVSTDEAIFIIEDNGTSYAYLRSKIYEILRIANSNRVYFLDFPLNGTITKLLSDGFDFRAFMDFVHGREVEFNRIEHLLPFIENHDSVVRASNKLDFLILNLLAEFFSYNSVMIYHGGELFREADSSRFDIQDIKHCGPIASALQELREALHKDEVTTYAVDTIEYLIDNNICVVSKKVNNSVIVLVINRSESEVMTSLTAGDHVPEIAVNSLSGKCTIEPAAVDGEIIISAKPRTVAFVRFELRQACRTPARPVAGRPLHVLMAAMEFENIPGVEDSLGRPLSVKSGGLGQVIGELVDVAPDIFAARNAKISFLFPLYRGVSKKNLSRLFSIPIRLNGRREQVDVLRCGSAENVYFAEHPQIGGRSCLTSSWNGGIYGYEDDVVEDCHFMAVFNQAFSEVARLLNCDVLHAHDYQTAIAGIYSENITSSILTIHNAGSGLPASFIRPSYVMPKAENERSVSSKVNTQVFSQISGIRKSVLDRFFQRKGGIDILRGAQGYNYHRFGLPAVTVSEAYAAELRTSWLDQVRQVTHQKGRAPADPFLLHIANGGERFEPLIGIDNGSAFQQIRRWRFAGPEGRQDIKIMAKRLVLQRYFKSQDNSLPLFCLLTRVTEQKNISAILAAAETALDVGAYFLIFGPLDQSVSSREISRIAYMAEKFPKRFLYCRAFVHGIRRHTLMAAADYTFIPSRYEPFGLTDIEFTAYGARVLARRTGGLTKLSTTCLYEWADTSDKLGEKLQVERLVRDAIADRPGPCLQPTSATKFSWSAALEKYWPLYGF